MTVSLNTDGGTGLQGYLDTLAQSFFVDKTIHATKIDVFFSGKDDALPVELSLRKIENNLPSPNVIAGSSVVIDNANIIVSSNSYSSTTFTFSAPVLLEPGQYCFALSSDSKKNQVYVATLGGTDLITESIISKQPYSGVLFLSSNGSTWEPDQTKDIKFKLYKANLTSTTATVDLVLRKNNFSHVNVTKLNINPFKSFNASPVVRVYHNNHGFPTGAYVKFRHLPGYLTTLANANSYVTFNGIPYNNIANVYFDVANVTNNGYTITLGTNAATTANITPGYFGGKSVMATSMLPYSTVNPSISLQAPAKTSVDHQISTTDTTFTSSGYVSINPDEYSFTTSQVIVDDYNRSISMSGAESFKYRLNLSTGSTDVSPVIYLPMSSMLFVAPDINYPLSTDNLTLDLVTITSANVGISIAASGVVTVASGDVKANVKTMKAGAYVTISGAGTANNNGTFRLTSVATDGSSFSIPAANATYEPSGNAITLVYRPMHVSERAAHASSSRAKYITRRFDLATPSTALMVKFAVSLPANAQIEVYYKTLDGTEITTFDDKEFTPLTLPTITNTVKDQYTDVEAFIDKLTSFSSLMIKIVMNSTTMASYPQVKDLRIIALA